MLWMFNNVVLDLCRLVWRHFPHWYRFQNNRNIYRRSSTSMLHRHLYTIARKRQTLNFTYRFFVVRPHTLGRPSLRQSSHHHLFFPPASVLILRHNTWMLPCFLSKQGCDSTHWAERERARLGESLTVVLKLIIFMAQKLNTFISPKVKYLLPQS